MNAPANAPALSLSRSEFSEQQFIAIYCGQSLKVVPAVVCTMGFLAAVALNHLPLLLVALWFALVMGGLWYRCTLPSLPTRAGLTDPQRVRIMTRASTFNGFSHALSLGAFPFMTHIERAASTLVLLAIATGALATIVGHRGMLKAYVLPILIPLAAMWAWSPGNEPTGWLGVGLAVLIVLYGGVLFGLARETHRVFIESCDIRFQEQALNEKLRLALEQAQTANNAKTRFLAAASHDLRQPLHTITLLVAALSMRLLDVRSKGIVQLLTQVSEGLSAQLDGLLDISKLDAGVVQANMAPVKLADLVARHFSEIEEPLRARGLEPRLRLDADGWVQTDPDLLLRILRNLTQNAIKFTPAGHVELALEQRGGHLDVLVQDTGPGIPEALHEQVFQEFYQIDNPERDRSKGLGLGLSIVRRLALLLGIELRMKSRLGAGTSFRLSLPIAAGETSTNAPEQTLPSADRFDLLVLVVDDEKSVRTSLRILLEEMGCECLEAAGTEEALQVVADVRPDLLLADFRLRGDDSGIDTIEAVRARWRDVPALLVSGDTAPDRLVEAERAGIRLLHKPLSVDALKDVLQAAQERDPTISRRQ